MKNFEIKNQNGRSMIEMLGVLAIIGVLSVGGIAGYSKAMMKYRINKTIEQITLIAGNVRTFFAAQKNYRGAECGSQYLSLSGQYLSDIYYGCKVAKKAKLFPDEMLTITNGSITNIENAFGGKFGIGTSDGRDFYLVFNQVPLEACIELASYDWRSANAISLGLSKFNNDTFGGNEIYYHNTLPANVEDVITECSALVANGRNIGLFILFK